MICSSLVFTRIQERENGLSSIAKTLAGCRGEQFETHRSRFLRREHSPSAMFLEDEWRRFWNLTCAGRRIVQMMQVRSSAGSCNPGSDNADEV
jgi:hypothetical protein